LEARPKTDGRNVSTAWENWRGEGDAWVRGIGEEEEGAKRMVGR
jgi:hypothetical protein